MTTAATFDIAYVTDFFSGMKENQDYIAFHKYRYLYLLQLIQELSKDVAGDPIELLDVGPMFQTNLIRKSFPEIRVHTMGEHYPINHLRVGERHIELDLNYTEKYIDPEYPKHDIILFAEVIEHLYTPPEIILEFLKNFLNPGGFIVLQTPNAVAIHKRLKILAGKHPFDLLTYNRRGHFREYTRSEMLTFLTKSGFRIIRTDLRNYFNNTRTVWHRAFGKLEKVIPPNFRDGMTIVGQLTH